MDRVFIEKLKSTLDALIKENEILKSEIAALNHSVNDVIIGGLKDAANEYEDNENYSVFCDKYNEKYSPLVEASKVLYGDDYDISSDLYEGSKNAENVDEFVDAEIEALQAKLDSLRALKNGNEEEVVVEEAISPEEELANIASKYLR